MALSKVKVLQSSLRSFKTTVENTQRDKDSVVSTSLAEHYNSLRAKAAAFSELAEHLPPEIKSTSPFASMGISDAHYPDLMVYLNQLVDLTDILEDSDEA